MALAQIYWAHTTLNPGTDVPKERPPTGLTLERIYEHPAHLVRRSYQIFMSAFDSELTHKGLTPIYVIILAVLNEHPGIDVSTLAQAAAIDKTSCGRAITRLSRKKFVRIAISQDDGRQKCLFLTQQGRQIFASCSESIERIEEQLLGRFSPQEKLAFMGILHKFVDRNNEISRAPFKKVDELPLA